MQTSENTADRPTHAPAPLPLQLMQVRVSQYADDTLIVVQQRQAAPPPDPDTNHHEVEQRGNGSMATLH